MKHCCTAQRRTNTANRIRLLASCTLAAATCAGTAAAQTAPAGTLIVARSPYQGTASTVTVGQTLPNTNGATATADGSYPGVFANDSVDGNFGITSPIVLDTYPVTQSKQRFDVGAISGGVNVTAKTGVATSFSSKSELGLHLSTDGTAVTFTGYTAKVNTLDVSNANTPDNVDPTNTDTAPATYRTVVQYDVASGKLSTTPTDAYSGNNGRGAILANNVNGSGIDEYLLVGNAGNGSGTEPTDIVNNTGVQAVAPGAGPTTSVIGAQQGTPGNKTGFQYGFSVASIGQPADKSGKDDNFRGATVFDNTLYVSKGSGSNGVDTVYQVTAAGGGLPTAATSSTTQISILPGFPTTLASQLSDSSPSTEFYPFGLFFANATTLYVADEGSQDLNADPHAGLQKWIYDGTRWNLAYTIQAGLNLDQPYSLNGYPTGDNPATTGLRQLTGVVTGNTVTIFAVTATYSNLGDPGADPNAIVKVVDTLDATSPGPNEAFVTQFHPRYGQVYRGVVFVPATP
jgi:hypothetical protein